MLVGPKGAPIADMRVFNAWTPVAKSSTTGSPTQRFIAGFTSPTPSKSRFSRMSSLELNEKLPPSPSDPQACVAVFLTVCTKTLC